jgi:hypothetical protein
VGQDSRLPQITDSPRDTAATSVVAGTRENVGFRRALFAAAESEKQLEVVRAEAAHAVAELQEARKVLREERLSRVQQAAQASAQISLLQTELAVVATVPVSVVRTSHKAHLLLPLGSLAMVAIAVGVLILHPAWVQPREVANQSTWQPAAAVPRPIILTEGVDSGPRNPSEVYALARLNGALDEVPIPAMPSIMGAVNDWLWSIGLPPCSVASPRGDVSLVISSSSPGQPLLAALSRCAEGVEHFNRLSEQRPQKRGKQ